jgi:hypothetical protein
VDAVEPDPNCDGNPCICRPDAYFVECLLCGQGACTSDGYYRVGVPPQLRVPPDYDPETDVCDGCLDGALARGYRQLDGRPPFDS